MASASHFEEDLQYAKEQFGVTFTLKQKQLEALESIYNGNDTVAVLPTGYGKSIVFQACIVVVLILLAHYT